MKKAISIPDLLAGETKEEKGMEFTHILSANHGWVIGKEEPKSNFTNVIYLGKCAVDGDMFCAYRKNGAIVIYKGHLNNGTY